MIIAQQTTSVDIASVGANTTLVVAVDPVVQFRPDLPIHVILKSDETALDTGLLIGNARYNISTGKINFTVANVTASPINPAARNFVFMQVQ